LGKKFMSTDEVIERFVRTTKAWYKISTGDGQPTVREGNVQPILVNIVRRHDHTITYISGFETFCLDADSLAEKLKTACASSTAVQPNFRDSSLKQVMVQGQHVQFIVECLADKGIHEQWIKVINRTGAKLKKPKTKKRPPT